MQYLQDAISHRQDGEFNSEVDKKVDQEIEDSGEEEEDEEDEGEESGEESEEDERDQGRRKNEWSKNEFDGTVDASVTEERVSEDGHTSESMDMSGRVLGHGTANVAPIIAVKGIRKQRKQAVRAVQGKTRSVQRSRNATKDKGGRRSRHVRGGGED